MTSSELNEIFEILDVPLQCVAVFMSTDDDEIRCHSASIRWVRESMESPEDFDTEFTDIEAASPGRVAYAAVGKWLRDYVSQYPVTNGYGFILSDLNETIGMILDTAVCGPVVSDINKLIEKKATP